MHNSCGKRKPRISALVKRKRSQGDMRLDGVEAEKERDEILRRGIRQNKVDLGRSCMSC